MLHIIIAHRNMSPVISYKCFTPVKSTLKRMQNASDFKCTMPT